LTDINIIIFASDKQIPILFDNVKAEFKRLYTIDVGIASPTNNDVYVNHIALLRFLKGNARKFNNIKNSGRSIVKMKYRKNLKEGNLHKHQKEVQMLSVFVQYWSNIGDIVLDLFAGSGSIAYACSQVKRNSINCDIDELNCQTIIDRFKANYTNVIVEKLNQK